VSYLFPDSMIRADRNNFSSSTKIAVEAQHGLIAQVIKDVIFSMRPKGTSPSSSSVGDVVDMAIG